MPSIHATGLKIEMALDAHKGKRNWDRS
jgi:hypothetical protein